MSNSGGSSTSRVSIPNSVRKTIQNIKEIAKSHNEDDIYAMLRECSMDPNETAQRLLHLDTFHQVKSKRDKRKEVVKNRPGEESRWKPGHQRRGTRGTRGNTSLQYTSNDVGDRRSNSNRKENGVEESTEKGFRNHPDSVTQKMDNVHPHKVEKALPISVNGHAKLPNGNLGGGHDPKPHRINAHGSKQSTGAGSDSSSIVRPMAIAEHAPSVSNPALIPPGGSWISVAVGAIKPEVRVQQSSAKESAHIPADTGVGKIDSPRITNQNQSEPQKVDGSVAYSGTANEESSKPEIVAQPDVLQDLSAADQSEVPTSILDIQPSSPQGVVPLAVSGADVAASKLVKLKFGDAQHVIIPDHIQVPDAVRSLLNFGSIDASCGVGGNYGRNENIKSSHSGANAAPDEAIGKASSCDEDVVSTPPQAELTDHQQSQSHSPADNYPVETQVSSSATKGDQPKEDTFPAVGPPFPIVQAAPSYNFGFMPPMVANTLVQPEGFESQTHVSSSLNGGSAAVSTPSSTPPLTQSPGLGQASVPVSPQPVPLFRQPYPPNYLPYSHYYSPFYVPSTMHQYYGHTAFPQPLPNNGYIPPPTAATAMKNSPAHYKPGSNAGNQVPAGMPAGYGVYSSSQAGYGPNTPVTTGNLTSSEDLMPTALKDNNVYPGQQSEGPPAWLSAAGRDPANFLMNPFLSFPPQGQHLISSQSGHGPFAVYHTLQPMPTPPPGHPMLQQSQPVTGPVESVGPPSNAYQQSQHQHQHQQQMNWNV